MARMAQRSPLSTARAPVIQAGRAILPDAVTAHLLAEVDTVASLMTRRIASEISLPAQFRSIGYLRLVMSACRDALRTLVRLLRDGRGLRSADLQRLGSMGAQQAEMGVPLEVLLAAYRLAARVVWREVIGEAAGLEELPQATVIAVTGQVLEYLDDISGAVGAAYLETRERLVRRRDRDRDRILQRLVAGDTGEELRRLAAATDLELAPPWQVIACAVPSEDAERAIDQAWRRRGVLVVPETPRNWLALLPLRISVDSVFAAAVAAHPEAAALRAGVGPVATQLAEVPGSARSARAALAVGERIEPQQLRHDHAEMGLFAALAADAVAMRSYVDGVLGRVLSLPQGRREVLLDTLEAITRTTGVNEAATVLHLHRHTVVYRLRRLADLGLPLDDGAAQHRVWLALQCLRLLEPSPLPI